MPSPVSSVTDLPPAQRVTLPDRGHGSVTLSVHDTGPADDPSRPAVIFSHGFPELAYSWRYQLPAVAAAGFRAIAPDQRGYGGSDAPEEIEAYDLGALCTDLDSLAEALGVERAIYVGHDWGGAVIWGMPTLAPERVAGLVGICTPMMAFPGTDLLKMLVEGDVERQYMLWFQEPGVAEAAMEPHVDEMFRKLMIGGVPLEEVMGRAFADGKLDMNPFRDIPGMEPIGEPMATDEEVAHYAEVFGRTGLRGGINWYRNLDRNVQLYPDVAKRDPGVPCLMLCAEWDPALPPAMSDGMSGTIADLERHIVPRSGHWVQQESPTETNAFLVDWLQRRFGA